MKKILLIIIPIIIASIGGYFFYQNKPLTEKDFGEIKPRPSKEMEKQYNKISEYAYHGEINFRDMYIVFKPSEYEDEFASKYECVIYEKEDGYYFGDTYYTVYVDGEDVYFRYTSGENDFDLEGTYDGELTINGVKMEKINPDDLEHASYGYGELAPATVENEEDYRE